MTAGMNFHLVLESLAQPGLCLLRIRSLEGPGGRRGGAGQGRRGGAGGSRTGGGVEVRRATPGVSGSPLKAGQPHLSTLRRLGDRRIVIVRPPPPTLTKSNHLLPKPPSHRGPQPRCWDRSYSCVRNPDQSG